jgi:hypothetical protein
MSTLPPPPAARVDELLAEMAQRGRSAVEVMERPAAPSVRAPKVRYTHAAMIDLMLENPWISQNQLAAHFGYSAAWISTVITSDAFQAMYEARRAELIDPELQLSLRERFQALTTKSLQVLQEKLSRPAGDIPDQLVLRAAELGAKSLGFGVQQQTTQVVVTSDERIKNLAHRLVAMHKQPPPAADVIDV